MELTDKHSEEFNINTNSTVSWFEVKTNVIQFTLIISQTQNQVDIFSLKNNIYKNNNNESNWSALSYRGCIPQLPANMIQSCEPKLVHEIISWLTVIHNRPKHNTDTRTVTSTVHNSLSIPFPLIQLTHINYVL